MDVVMLTTIDNPYDPFTQWDQWFNWDVLHGYNSCGLLARIAHTSDGISEADNRLEIENAIDEIINFDALKVFKKVKKSINDEIKSNEEES